MRTTTRWTSGAIRWTALAGVALGATASAASAAPQDMPLNGDQIVKIIMFGGGLCVAALYIVFGSIKSTVKSKEREQTKRELAAYVAEGSMKPEDAERILKADAESSEEK